MKHSVCITILILAGVYHLPAQDMEPVKTLSELIAAYRKQPESYPVIYELACTYARQKNADSTLYYLNRVLSSGHPDKDAILEDVDFNFFHADNRWKNIVSALDSLFLLGNHCKNKSLALQLRTLGITDQRYRSRLSLVLKHYSLSPQKMDSIYKIQLTIDSINITELEKIISQYGWPTISLVGKDASATAYMIVQHNKLIYQKKYLPILEEKAKQKEAEWGHYASMNDRILVEEGKKQFYGTQYKYNESTGEVELFPIEDVKNVDKRRKEMGLHPILIPWINELGYEVPPPKIAKE